MEIFLEFLAGVVGFLVLWLFLFLLFLLWKGNAMNQSRDEITIKLHFTDIQEVDDSLTNDEARQVLELMASVNLIDADDIKAWINYFKSIWGAANEYFYTERIKAKPKPIAYDAVGRWHSGVQRITLARNYYRSNYWPQVCCRVRALQ